jgi:hypothetical protein
MDSKLQFFFQNYERDSKGTGESADAAGNWNRALRQTKI